MGPPAFPPLPPPFPWWLLARGVAPEQLEEGLRRYEEQMAGYRNSRDLYERDTARATACVVAFPVIAILALLAVLILSGCASFPHEQWPNPPKQRWIMIRGDDLMRMVGRDAK